MQGRHIEDPGDEWDDEACQPGDYYKRLDGPHSGWHIVTPNGLHGWLKKHHVEEHEDGTISVQPGGGGSSNSILVSNGTGNKSWHGYIDHGVWKEC